MEKQGKLILTISGPSGSGKGTLMHEIVRHDPRIKFFITSTTRKPREGEFDGVHYFFFSKERFEKKLAEGDLLEYSEHYGNYYGTLKSVVDGHMAAGDDVLSDLNWRGVAQIQEKMPENLVKFLILPPSIEELERRFEKRKQKSKETPEAIAARFDGIREDILHIDAPDYVFTNADMHGSCRKDYDYVIVNDNLEAAVQEILTIIEQERAKRAA